MERKREGGGKHQHFYELERVHFLLKRFTEKEPAQIVAQ